MNLGEVEPRPHLEKSYSTYGIVKALFVARSQAFPHESFPKVDGTLMRLVVDARGREKSEAGEIWSTESPTGLKKFIDRGYDAEQVAGILDQLTRMSEEAHGIEHIWDTKFRADEMLDPKLALAIKRSKLTPGVIVRAESLLLGI